MLRYFRWLTKPDPWLAEKREQLAEFYRNHPHLKPKDLEFRADNMGASRSNLRGSEND